MENTFERIKTSRLDECGAYGRGARESLMEKAIRKFKNRDFEKFIWKHYMLRDSDFIQYDINCQSQLLAMYFTGQKRNVY